MTGEGLGLSSGIGTLTDLDLSGTLVTDDKLRELSNYGQLEKLNLNYTRVTPDGMAALTHHRHLTTVWLANAKLTDNRLRGLNDLSSLKELNLSGIGLIKGDSQQFGTVAAKLVRLDLSNTGTLTNRSSESPDTPNWNGSTFGNKGISARASTFFNRSASYKYSDWPIPEIRKSSTARSGPIPGWGDFLRNSAYSIASTCRIPTPCSTRGWQPRPTAT